MQPNSMINRILLASSALAMALMAACSGPVQVPIQPQPQAPAYPIVVNSLGQVVLDFGKPGIGAQFAPVQAGASAAIREGVKALFNSLVDAPKR
jgi:hypothetical protein